MFKHLCAFATLWTIASGADACPQIKEPDLNDLFKAAAVIDAYVVSAEQVDIPSISRSPQHLLTLTVQQALAHETPRHIRVLFPNWPDLDSFQRRFPLRTSLTLAVDALRNGAPDAPAGPPLFRLADSPCGGLDPFKSNTVQARAIALIFDGQGDPQTEAALFNKLFGYGRRRN